MGLGFIIGRWQWIKHKNNPVARASIRWFLLTIMVSIGSALILYFIPAIFNESPLIPVWVAHFIILLLFIGLVLGVIKYRLFDVEQWWFNCWVWLFSGLSVLTIDLTLMYLLNIGPLETLGAAMIITAWCYFPIRQWLWTKKIYPRTSPTSDFFPLLTQSYISSPSAVHFEKSWPDILANIYLPLSVQIQQQPVETIDLSNHGLTIILPALNKQQHVVLSGKEKGAKLFNKHDVEFIEAALAYAKNCLIWKNNREEGAKQERERIMRDLHDDVGALLLTLIHKAESEESAVLARNALKGVRDSIYSLHDNDFITLEEKLSSWREEIKQRTDAAHVNLLWDTEALRDGTYLLSSRQVINLDRILRESITNIMKHADPKTISLCVYEHHNKLQIRITDDGISIDPSLWQANTGLYNLHVRAGEIGVELDWISLESTSGPGKGTRLTITLPNMKTNTCTPS